MFKQISILIVFTLFLTAGCSGGNPSIPGSVQGPEDDTRSATSHALWGYWQGVISSAEETIEFTPMREVAMHVNALVFLEPPPLVNLTLEFIEFNGDLINAVIGLRHPFLGLTEFTGFDVCGIFISNGSISGFSDPDILMAGVGDTRLLNPDGYARWWNPAEFPMGTMLGYSDGLLGAPDSYANYNATLNGYKYYCDDLADIVNTLEDVDLENRGMFSAGQKNIREYNLEIGTDGLIFNYAVDASWEFPAGDSPWSAPESFSENANRTEAWRIDITENTNTLWNDGSENGGDLTLSIDVYDWHNADLNTMRVESPGNFPMGEVLTATGGGEGYSTYQVEISDATPAEDEIDLLISVISKEENFGGFITGTNTTAYFTTTIEVAEESPTDPLKNIPLRTGVGALDVAIQHNNGNCWILYSDDQVWRHTSTDDYYTGTYIYTVTNDYSPFTCHPQRIDVNSLGVATFCYTSIDDQQCWSWVYNVDGTKLDEHDVINACPTYRKFPDVSAFVDQGEWANHIVHFAGGYYTLQPNPPYYRSWMYIKGPPNYDSWDGGLGCFCSTPSATGQNGLHHDYVTALDADQDGTHVWYLETSPENHCTKWYRLYFMTLAYSGEYFPSASDTAYWHDPVDLGRDDSNRRLLLDNHAGQGIISVWTGSATGGSYIGEVGDPSTISEQPRRIDGSDFDGKVFVIHGDTYGPSDGYLLSVFTSDELP